MSLAPVATVEPLLSEATPSPSDIQVAIRTHRHCAPEHASLVRRACLHDTSVLPRWHQEDRGRINAHRGVHVLAPPGAYARIPVWTNRQHWRTVVVPAVLAQHADLLRRRRVSRELLQQWANAKAGYARIRTGRQCIVRPSTLASVLECSERQVQKMNHVAREIGLEVVVLEGRMLNLDESTAARRRGSRQRGLSTEVALTVPAEVRPVVDSFTPTRGRATSHKPHRDTYSPHGLAAEKRGSAPPTHPHERFGRQRRARQLATEVIREVPWLATERPARLSPALTRFATAPSPWSAEDIAGAITSHTLRIGRDPIDEFSIRTRPAALLAHILRGIDEVADHPDGGFPLNEDPPVPCGAPHCDHGWIDRPDGRVERCPDCPPGVRAWREHAPHTGPQLDPDGDPPF